ncbi:MAG: 16S rRNA processing protein RimM [Syntrophaceae bacterium]|nr:16S rRNA processing protein RimM [Syntrophaceae bacterium]
MDLFEAGEIVKNRGLHGCLKVLSYLEAKSNFSKPDFVYIENIRGQKNPFRLKKIEKSGKAFFIELEEIKDADSAKDLVGCKIYWPKDTLKKLSPGEYYFHDIIGLDVFSEDGSYIGKIKSVFPTGSNDVYVCEGKNKEILLPAISDVIKKIDVDQRVMTVKIPDGL